jgi:hypothetical protein
MAATTPETTPTFVFMHSLIDTLVAFHGFDPSFARKISFRIKVNISSFDPMDEQWARIVKNYAIMIDKLYYLAEDADTMLVLASNLELTYTE